MGRNRNQFVCRSDTNQGLHPNPEQAKQAKDTTAVDEDVGDTPPPTPSPSRILPTAPTPSPLVKQTSPPRLDRPKKPTMVGLIAKARRAGPPGSSNGPEGQSPNKPSQRPPAAEWNYKERVAELYIDGVVHKSSKFRQKNPARGPDSRIVAEFDIEGKNQEIEVAAAWWWMLQPTQAGATTPVVRAPGQKDVGKDKTKRAEKKAKALEPLNRPGSSLGPNFS